MIILNTKLIGITNYNDPKQQKEKGHVWITIKKININFTLPILKTYQPSKTETDIIFNL